MRTEFNRQESALVQEETQQIEPMEKENKPMKAKAKAKVISLERRHEIRSVAETIRSGMIYQSLMLDGGEIGMKEGDGYFGLVYSIPSEEAPDSFLAPGLNDDPLLLMIDDENDADLPPMNGKAVERYEIYDMDTDDLHVMYRVPYRPMTLRPVKKDPETKKI